MRRIRIDDWAKKNPEKHRAKTARWRAKNPERARELYAEGHERNKEQRNAYSREYRATHLEHMRALSRQWAKDNAAKMLETTAKRRAAKKQAVPVWAKDELDSFIVSEMYDLAIRRSKATGQPWHVDHIVPLRSDAVCGLHCASNLRVIPGVENHRKGNREWPGMSV